MKDFSQGRAGDTITVTGKLKYDMSYNKDGYMFLTADDGKEFVVNHAPPSAIEIVKTAFKIGDMVLMIGDRASQPAGIVVAEVEGICFVHWAVAGFASAHPTSQLQRYVAEPQPEQVDLEDYLQAPDICVAAPPLTAAQLAEVDAEAEASELPTVEAEQPGLSKSEIF